MTLIDLDSKDVKNYTNKDGLIAISDLRMLALADDYVEVDQALEIIDKKIQFAKDCRISTIALWLVRNDIFALKGGEQEC